MKVLVTGAAGQLGRDVVKELQNRRIEVLGADIADFDITNGAAVFKYVRNCSPTHIVHCAAYTAVDKAEGEAALCRRINTLGTGNVARAAAELNAEIMYFSTDYVFDGFSKNTPWETDDIKNPQNIYGQSKLGGEQEVIEATPNHYILRVSWLFGKHGHNFIKTMLRLASGRNPIRVVNDQIGAPTYTKDVAKLACDMLESKKYGTYHTPNSGETSWYNFAAEIFAKKGICADLSPISTTEYPTAAKRPLNSRLSHAALNSAGFESLPHYSDALGRLLKELDS